MKTKTKIKHIVSTKGTDWKPFEGTEMPEQVIPLIKGLNGLKYNCVWLIGCVFYKGDINTTKDWIVVTDDGAFYKVGASWMVWYIEGEKTRSQAIWSGAALKKTIKSLITEGEIVKDPDYQT